MKTRFLLLHGVVIMFMLTGCTQEETVIPPTENPQYNLADFTSAQACASCHPQYFEEWNGSMHRYSTSDPIWMLANNALQQSTQGRLGKTCFQCHAPLGFLTGNTKSTFAFTDLDPLVREGITCDFCHVLRPPYQTTNQQVRYSLTPGSVKYGTLSEPVATPAHDHGYDVAYDRSEVCRQCHDLIVNGVPVEVTVTEWQNSAWGAMSVDCQKCHMPTYTGRAAPGGPIRNNLHRHDFPGVDVAITDFPHKPEQRAAIDSILKRAVTLTLEAPAAGTVEDSIHVEVSVYNDNTGHNVPTSVFFNRQMWLELTVWSGADTAYRSGYLDAYGDLMNRYSALRPNEDVDLVMFGGTLYKNGQESNVFELDSLVNNSIKPFESRNSPYRFKIQRTGMWNVRVRLLFRPFGPYLFRSLGADQYVTELPIFEMAREQAVINVF